MESLDDWKRANKELLDRMDLWRDSYTCKQNCEEWKKWKFCRHLRKARGQKFGEEINFMVNQLVNVNSKRAVLEPIQS